MKIAIYARLPGLYSTRRLIEECKNSGAETVIIDPDADEIKVPADVRLIIPRLGTWKFHDALETLEKIERKGLRSMNSSFSLRNSRDKWLTALLLKGSELPHPSTTLLFKKDMPKNFPYIVKKCDGMKGQQVYLIRQARDLISLDPNSEWICQEYIPIQPAYDYRLFVVADQVVAAIKREAKEGDFRSNLSLGGKATFFSPSTHLIDLAIKGARCFELDIAGVDLIVCPRRGPMIIEVNGCPGLEGIEKATGVNIASKIVSAAFQIIL